VIGENGNLASWESKPLPPHMERSTVVRTVRGLDFPPFRDMKK